MKTFTLTLNLSLWAALANLTGFSQETVPAPYPAPASPPAPAAPAQPAAPQAPSEKAPADQTPAVPVPSETPATPEGAPAQPAPAQPPAEPVPPPQPLPPLEPGQLRLNFRNAPLDMVLDYLSEAAGYTIILETPVRGTIDVWSNHPVSQEEALEILDAALARNGYTAIRDGKKLTVLNRDEAKNRSIPIVSSADWETIPQSDVIATYIIPVKYISANDLIQSLQPLIPEKMQISANQDSNSLIITDSQAAIRRIAHITSILDSSISSVSTIRVIPLKHADATELSKTITDLYANSARNSRSRSDRSRGGGGPPGFPFPFPGGEDRGR